MVPGIMSSRLSLLVDLASLASREVDLDQLLQSACSRIAEAVEAERATLWLVDAERGELVARVATVATAEEIPALRMPIGRGLAGHVAASGETVRIDDAAGDPRFDGSVDKATGYRTRSMIVTPVRESQEEPVRGVLQVLNRRGDGAFDEADERYVAALAAQFARLLSLTTLRAAEPSGPGVTLRGPFNHIVGRSDALASVYRQITLAAETMATVLLRGETGVGKGLFARAVHVNSERQGGPFVTLDCTTLPAQLVESELFGHERGAFTGADRRVIGRIETASGGTLFLDEIGDLPLDLQGKLLRVLQERTFERVGGRTSLDADVRIVCATHRDLEKAIDEGRFREDLYYRLRVVEIEVPTLRARGPEEIIRLAHHFAELYARRYRRPPSQFSPAALEALRAHSFPGNVRELEHWVESAVVLAEDGHIERQHLPRARRTAKSVRPGALPTPPSSAASTPSLAPSSESSRGVRLPLDLTADQALARYVKATVEAEGGNRSLAARKLGLGRNTVARMVKRRDGG
jgi:transcriptional regulator with GAF, ATPase, and Fis domain